MMASVQHLAVNVREGSLGVPIAHFMPQDVTVEGLLWEGSAPAFIPGSLLGSYPGLWSTVSC